MLLWLRKKVSSKKHCATLHQPSVSTCVNVLTGCHLVECSVLCSASRTSCAALSLTIFVKWDESYALRGIADTDISHLQCTPKSCPLSIAPTPKSRTRSANPFVETTTVPESIMLEHTLTILPQERLLFQS